jgi:hypothetical protein
MVASPSPATANKAPTLEELTAEAHRLYALLVPQGPVQVIVPEHERARMMARYNEVCALLTAAQKGQKEQRAAAEKWAQEAQEALPELIAMAPAEWRGKLQAIGGMPAGPERDSALRAALNEVVNGGALAKLGPIGIAVGPMIRKFLRTGKL